MHELDKGMGVERTQQITSAEEKYWPLTRMALYDSPYTLH